MFLSGKPTCLVYFEVLSDSSSLTPGKITADKQVAAILHRGRAFEARDLAALAAGSDPMAAIGAKVADYVANQRQKDLLSCLGGVFGSLNANTSSSAFFDLCIDSESGDTPTALVPTSRCSSPRHPWRSGRQADCCGNALQGLLRPG